MTMEFEYPETPPSELINFLEAEDELQITKLAPLLKEKYRVKPTDWSRFVRISPIEMVSMAGKTEHLKALFTIPSQMARINRAFCRAILNNQLATCNLILEKGNPTELVDYALLCMDLHPDVIYSGQWDLFKRLLDFDAVQKEILSSAPFIVLFLTKKSQHSVINRMLEVPELFAKVEIEPLCEPVVAQFILAKLESLEQQIQTWNQTQESPFNLTDSKEALLFYYVLRHVIRINDSGLNEVIPELLNIRAIKLLAPRTMNELLTLAKQVGNQKAEQLLLQLPVVNTVAKCQSAYLALYGIYAKMASLRPDDNDDDNQCTIS